MMNELQKMLTTAWEHYTAGRYADAASICRQVLESAPDNGYALYLSGTLYHLAGQNETAVKQLARSVTIQPDPFAYNTLGVAFQALKKLPEAENAYRQALALKSDYAIACRNLGVVLANRGQLQEAEACYRQAIEHQPDFTAVYINYACMLLAIDRLDEAATLCRQALALEPDNVTAKIHLNHILAQGFSTKSHLLTTSFGIPDQHAFEKALLDLVMQTSRNGWWAGDNLFTFERNLGFLSDERFMVSINAHVETYVERTSLWRYHTLCWAASNAMRLPGDFMECACYKGTSARIVCDYVAFGASGKRYFLYDLFEHDSSMPHHTMPAHGNQLYERVKQRFSDISTVTVTQGRVPEVLHEVAPDHIAFLHLDLNNAAAEIGALELLWERMVPGALLVLDDYGWLAYREQHVAENYFFNRIGYKILELPTGQGLVIK